MYVCVYVLFDVCMYVCMYICTVWCICMYVCVYVCMYCLMYVCMYICMYVCTVWCMYVHMYVCLYVCMYCLMYVCMYACALSVYPFNLVAALLHSAPARHLFAPRAVKQFAIPSYRYCFRSRTSLAKLVRARAQIVSNFRRLFFFIFFPACGTGTTFPNIPITFQQPSRIGAHWAAARLARPLVQPWAH